jgi:pyruvate formate lyase activating enzyme
LVLRAETLPTFPLDYFIGFLDSRKDWLDGVCITGGEPLLHQDLNLLLSLIKDRNLLIKIDTNGSFPSRLEKLIELGLIDCVAMDVKAPLARYEEVVKAPVRKGDIAKSIEIIKDSGLKYFFRTTVVPGLVGADDILELSQMLQGSRIFQIQQFMPTNTLDNTYLHKVPFSSEEIQLMARMAEPFFEEVRVEGI